MQNIIIKTATPLSLVIILGMGSVLTESQANEDKVFFLSNKYNETFALNGMRGKPPYNRSIMKQQRRRNQQSVEMSALEINQGSTVNVSSQISGKGFSGGHPDRAKRRSYRH